MTIKIHYLLNFDLHFLHNFRFYKNFLTTFIRIKYEIFFQHNKYKNLISCCKKSKSSSSFALNFFNTFQFSVRWTKNYFSCDSISLSCCKTVEWFYVQKNGALNQNKERKRGFYCNGQKKKLWKVFHLHLLLPYFLFHHDLHQGIKFDKISMKNVTANAEHVKSPHSTHFIWFSGVNDL